MNSFLLIFILFTWTAIPMSPTHATAHPTVNMLAPAINVGSSSGLRSFVFKQNGIIEAQLKPRPLHPKML